VLRKNLEGAEQAFPFVVTGGVELEEWADTQAEAVRRGWARAVTGLALGFAIKSLEDYLARHYPIGRLGRMKPGSIPDWPLAEQRPLFALLGDVQGSVGVELRPDFFMRPVMTTSGVYFPDPEGFECCLLCPRADCPGRVMPYDEGLFARKFR
jgi:cobalamin-dependent methionine synthase I